MRSVRVSHEQMYAIARATYQPRSSRRPRSPWPGRLRNGALLAGAVITLSLGLARVAEGGAPSGYEAVSIQPGDTLWTIASDRYPGADVRSKVWQIEQANHLDGVSLHPGQTIRVPSR